MALEHKFTHGGKPCEYMGCINDAIEGSSRCLLHGGQQELARINKANVRSYMLSRWNASIDRFHKADNIKSLREEIAISRMTLESILLKCESEYDILLYSGKITNVLETIRKLVLDCNRIEDRLGYTLDKSATINLAENLVMIVGQYIDEEQLPEVAKRVATAIGNATSLESVIDVSEIPNASP